MRVAPLSTRTWPALERLFGPNGADAGCWCMFFRLPRPEWRAGLYEPNRVALRELAGSGEPVGLLAFDGPDPVGWVAVAPRPVYPRLTRSTVAKPVDPEEDLTGVWSVTCFFVHRPARRSGISGLLLDEAVRFAGSHGARTVEGYPVDTRGEKRDSGDLFHGTLSLFLAHGFHLVERRGVRRALVRKEIG
jgi:GNAT superfamily N-acetyltransferase